MIINLSSPPFNQEVLISCYQPRSQNFETEFLSLNIERDPLSLYRFSKQFYFFHYILTYLNFVQLNVTDWNIFIHLELQHETSGSMFYSTSANQIEMHLVKLWYHHTWQTQLVPQVQETLCPYNWFSKVELGMRGKVGVWRGKGTGGWN